VCNLSGVGVQAGNRACCNLQRGHKEAVSSSFACVVGYPLSTNFLVDVPLTAGPPDAAGSRHP
jgi:hypothetical protein